MACENEWNGIRQAYDSYVDAAKDQFDAEEKLKDEEGFWEEETAGTGAGLLTIGGAIAAGILTGGIGGVVVFILGSGAGTGAIVYSESDRQDDIDAAKSALNSANKAMANAESAWNNALAAFCRCKARAN